MNGLNQYTAAGSAAPTYDSNGNLMGMSGTAYGYDVENRLISASGGSTAGLVYTPTGSLYETTGGSGTTRYLYDGDALVAEYNSAGTLLRRYLHGPGVDEPLVWFEGASRRHLRANHQGSIVAVSDNAGAGIAINSYDEYGVPATGNVGRFAYTGQIILPELGMYHYKARIYAPRLGRFMQTDPVGYEDQINLYAYVGNDPVNVIDPSGAWMFGPGDWLAGSTLPIAQGIDDIIFSKNWAQAGKAAAPLLDILPVTGGLSSAAEVYHDPTVINVVAAVASAAPGGAGTGRAIKSVLHSLDDLSRAAGAVSRKGGFTAAGHSLTKHGSGKRAGNSLFPAPYGNASSINQQAQTIVDDILTAPGTTTINGYRGRFGSTIEYVAPDGRGVVYDAKGKFLFFREGNP